MNHRTRALILAALLCVPIVQAHTTPTTEEEDLLNQLGTPVLTASLCTGGSGAAQETRDSGSTIDAGQSYLLGIGHIIASGTPDPDDAFIIDDGAGGNSVTVKRDGTVSSVTNPSGTLTFHLLKHVNISSDSFYVWIERNSSVDTNIKLQAVSNAGGVPAGNARFYLFAPTGELGMALNLTEWHQPGSGTLCFDTQGRTVSTLYYANATACIPPDVECTPYGAAGTPLAPEPFRTWNETSSVNLSWTYVPGSLGGGAGEWNDSTDSHDLIPATAAYTSPGYSGNSMTLNGTMDGVANMTGGTDIHPFDGFSVGMWLKREPGGANETGNQWIFEQYTPNGTVVWGITQRTTSKLSVETDGMVAQTGDNFIKSGVWYHVVSVANLPANNMSLYVNGSWVSTAAITWIGQTTGAASGYDQGAPWIGYHFANTTRAFTGQLDNLTVCNCTWTPTQVANFHTGTEPPANATFYFEPSSPATGISVLGYNITRRNATTVTTFYAGNVTTWRDTNVTIGEHYNYTVRGWNSVGNGTPTYRFPGHATGAPAAPTLQGAEASCSVFALNWTEPEPFTSYRVYRNSTAYPVNRTFYIPPEGNFTLRLLNDTYPKISATLTYTVAGRDANGNYSTLSNSVNFTPPTISTVGDCGLAFGGMSQSDYLAMAGLTGASEDALGILFSIILVLIGAAAGYAIMSSGGAAMGAGAGMLLSVALGYLPPWAIIFTLGLLIGGYFISRPGGGRRRRR